MGISRLRLVIFAAGLLSLFCQSVTDAQGASRIASGEVTPLRAEGRLDFAIIIPPFIEMRRGFDKPTLEGRRYPDISSIMLVDETTSEGSRDLRGGTSFIVTSNAGAILFAPSEFEFAGTSLLSRRTWSGYSRGKAYIFAMP
jgi:hypothetical protein